MTTSIPTSNSNSNSIDSQHKITKEQFDLFCSEELSVKEHKKLAELITERFVHIITSIATKFRWVDYSNEGGDEDSPGHFSINAYKTNIEFVGDYKIPDPYGCDNEIPTRWLWEDFMDEFQTKVEAEKKKSLEIAQRLQEEKELNKRNRSIKFLKNHNMTVDVINHKRTQKVAIVFNNPKLTPEYVIEFLNKNLK